MKTKEVKKQEARNRQETHNKLTNVQKITKLDEKLEIGAGAGKERAKLSKK